MILLLLFCVASYSLTLVRMNSRVLEFDVNIAVNSLEICTLTSCTNVTQYRSNGTRVILFGKDYSFPADMANGTANSFVFTQPPQAKRTAGKPLPVSK